MLWSVVLAMLFLGLVYYLVSSYVMMVVYNKLNYSNAWFSFIPVLSNYIMFKLIIDGFYVDKIGDSDKTDEYKSNRKSKAVIFTLLIILISGGIGAVVGGMDASQVVDDGQTTNLTNITNLYSFILTIIISYFSFVAFFKLFPKKTTEVTIEDQDNRYNQSNSDSDSVVGKAIAYTFLNLITFGLFQIIYAYKLTSDEYDVRFKD